MRSELPKGDGAVALDAHESRDKRGTQVPGRLTAQASRQTVEDQAQARRDLRVHR
jgi:hypothetical protein